MLQDYFVPVFLYAQVVTPEYKKAKAESSHKSKTQSVQVRVFSFSCVVGLVLELLQQFCCRHRTFATGVLSEDTVYAPPDLWSNSVAYYQS